MEHSPTAWTQFIEATYEFRAQLFSLAVTSIVYFFNRFLLGPKLKWAVEHEHHYCIPVCEGNQPVKRVEIDTVAIFVQNTGRSTADNVDVIFNYEPKTYDIVPPKKFTVHSNPDKRFVITFERLQPREHISIRLIDVRPGQIPYILSVSHKNGGSKMVPMAPHQILSRNYLLFLQLIFYIGVFACVYIIVTILRFVLNA